MAGTYKIAFWNVGGMGNNVQDKLSTFWKWLKNVEPDLLIMEEVSFTWQQRDDPMDGTSAERYVELGKVEVLQKAPNTDQRTDPSTKNLVALTKKRDRSNWEVGESEFPRLVQKRPLIRVTRKDQSRGAWFEVWGIHANASEKGGRNAVHAGLYHLTQPEGRMSVIGGDFNIHIHKPKDIAGSAEELTVQASVDHQGGQLKFTQWNQRGANQMSRDDAVGLGLNRQINTNFQGNNILDYVMCRSEMNLNVCKTFNEFQPEAIPEHQQVRSSTRINPTANAFAPADLALSIYANFDHLPVVVEITPPTDPGGWVPFPGTRRCPIFDAEGTDENSLSAHEKVVKDRVLEFRNETSAMIQHGSAKRQRTS